MVSLGRAFVNNRKDPDPLLDCGRRSEVIWWATPRGVNAIWPWREDSDSISTEGAAIIKA